MKNEKPAEYLIYAGVLLLGIVLFLTSGSSAQTVKEIEILPPGSKATEYVFDVTVGEETYEDIGFKVQPREYREEELEALLEKCLPKAREKLLNGNESFDRVEDNLFFFEKLDGYPFSFEWSTGAPDRIGANGELLSAETFDTNLSMLVYYKSFSRDFSISVHAVPGKRISELKTKEKIAGLLTGQLEKNAMNNAETESIKLPESMDGEKLTYSIGGSRRNPIYIPVTLATILLIWYGFRLDREKQRKNRIEEIKADYPGMLRQMMMYLSAGMTVRNIWFLLCEEAAESGESKRPLYSEMEITTNELKSGASEIGAYTAFGKRTATQETVRFAALLSQNLKTGGSRLSDLLREETEKAELEKKQRAIKAGEEAGTKLLFPMMLLLGDMMAIIMVPAFMTII